MPSGAQARSESEGAFDGCGDQRLAAPVGATVQISFGPPNSSRSSRDSMLRGSRRNAIREPSGDHAGANSSASSVGDEKHSMSVSVRADNSDIGGSVGTSVWTDASIAIRAAVRRPRRRRSGRSSRVGELPDGVDQVVDHAHRVAVHVGDTGRTRSALATKAICVPSGDQAGSDTSMIVHRSATWSPRLRRSAPSRSRPARSVEVADEGDRPTIGRDGRIGSRSSTPP